MKSIIEEAPSILKAIEKAWARAGNPVEFSVKIFEDAQKNFFGLTSKNAKVGVFFEIEPIHIENTRHGVQSASEELKQRKPSHIQHREPIQNRSTGSVASSRGSEEQVVRSQHRSTNYEAQAPQQQTEGTAAPEDVQERKKRVAWNDEMLTAVNMWLNDLLKMSNLGSHQPTLTVLDNRLIVLFATPLFEDPAKASDLYRSLSYLLIGMIRSKFKREFRFLKIVLTDGLRDRDHNES